MWLKLTFLCLYLLLLFILSRLLEVASWYNGNKTFLNTRVLLDPFSLSVKKLKQLLDNRGVNYCGVVEKKELVQLVAASGTPSEEEQEEEVPTVQSTQFSCGSHFYEEVEDTKDSVWLVQVATGEQQQTLLDDSTWNEVVSKVGMFGVRTGVFHCSLDKRLCSRKDWKSPRLILALPKGSRAKEDVVFHTYMKASRASKILKWVQTHLVSSVKQITSESDLKHKWMTYNSLDRESEPRLILFAELDSPPIFYSSLAIKFTGRAKFAMIHMNSENRDAYKSVLGSSKLPVYMIVTSEEVTHYGQRRGENFRFKDMELVLKWLRPEMNDIFLLSLLVTNLVLSFEMFFAYNQLWKHIVRCLYHFFKYNSILFLSWLLILGLYKFSIMDTITEISLKCTRLISGTDIVALIRNDWNRFSFRTLLAIYALFGAIVGYITRKCNILPVEEDMSFTFEWWTSSRSSFVTSYFFRPIPTFSRPMVPRDLELDDGMELLIERMAVPNLWLQPIISNDYIKDLPSWKYRGWCDEDAVNMMQSQSSSEDEPVIANSSCTMPSNGLSSCYQPNSPTLDNFPAYMVSEEQTVPDSNPNQASHKSHFAKCKHEKPSCDNPFSPEKRCLECDKDSKGANGNAVVGGNSKLCSTSFLSKSSDIRDLKWAPPGMLEIRECSICLECYRFDDKLCGLPCGHNFHYSCIVVWLLRDNHCCPICRWPSYKSKLLHLHSQ